MAYRILFSGEQDVEGEAKMLDVSMNGCREASTINVTVGAPLQLSLFLPNSYEWPRLVEEAVVRWINERQFGLEFTDIQSDQRESLSAFIMKTKS